MLGSSLGHLRSLRDDSKAFGEQSRAVGQEFANPRDVGRFDEDTKDFVLEGCHFSLGGCCCGVQNSCGGAVVEVAED